MVLTETCACGASFSANDDVSSIFGGLSAAEQLNKWRSIHALNCRAYRLGVPLFAS